MSWSAHLQHTDTGLAITFAQPLSRLDMTPDVAQHLARLLAAEANCNLHRCGSTVGFMRERHVLCCDCSACLNGDRSK